MREAFRTRNPAGFLLQCVIADLTRGVHRLFEIAGLDHAEPVAHLFAPDAGQTIGLQFDAHRNLVGLRVADLGAQAVGLAQNAQLVLHMMADFMRHNIGLREIPPGAKLARHRGEEIRVQINLLVPRAIKRPGLARGSAAGRIRDPRIQHQHRRMIGLAHLLLEQRRPDVLGFRQRLRDELRRSLISRRQLGLAAITGLAAADVQLPVKQRRKIHAEEPADHDNGHKPQPRAANPAPTATAPEPAAATAAAA